MTHTTPEEPWVAGYQAAMTAFLLKNATLVAKTASKYDWAASDDGHRFMCPVTLAEGGSFHERSITEWGGTFDGDHERVVIDAYGVSCGCGAIKDRTVRYEGSLGDLLTAFLGGLSNMA